MTSRRSAITAAATVLVAATACSNSTPGRLASGPSVATPSVAQPSVAGPSVTGPSAASAPGTPGPTAAPSGSTPSPTVIPAPSSPLRTVTTQPVDGRSYVVQVWAEREDASCAGHAYGAPMIAFLTAHPCLGLRRELATTTVDGRAVGISIVSTGFRGTAQDPYAVSAAFRRLVVKDGTGSIDDLLREGYRLPSGPVSVPSPDAFSAVGQDNGIDVYDAWYLQGRTPNNDKRLVQMTEDIFLQV